jgi:hypothetical protein
MGTIIKEALKLPEEEKIKLFVHCGRTWNLIIMFYTRMSLAYEPLSEVKQRLREMENNKNIISLEEHIDFIKKFGQ